MRFWGVRGAIFAQLKDSPLQPVPVARSASAEQAIIGLVILWMMYTVERYGFDAVASSACGPVGTPRQAIFGLVILQ